jgi:hypothetical protein
MAKFQANTPRAINPRKTRMARSLVVEVTVLHIPWRLPSATMDDYMGLSFKFCRASRGHIPRPRVGSSTEQRSLVSWISRLSDAFG